MRRVDGDAGDLQRVEGLITRPLPLLLWIDGSEQPHIQQLAYQTAADARARTAELVASLQQQIASGKGKRRNDGSAEQPPAEKAKHGSGSAKKKKRQAVAAAAPTVTTAAVSAAPANVWRPPSVKADAQDALASPASSAWTAMGASRATSTTSSTRADSPMRVVVDGTSSRGLRRRAANRPQQLARAKDSRRFRVGRLFRRRCRDSHFRQTCLRRHGAWRDASSLPTRRRLGSRPVLELARAKGSRWFRIGRVFCHRRCYSHSRQACRRRHGARRDASGSPTRWTRGSRLVLGLDLHTQVVLLYPRIRRLDSSRSLRANSTPELGSPPIKNGQCKSEQPQALVKARQWLQSETAARVLQRAATMSHRASSRESTRRSPHLKLPGFA